MNIDSKLVLVEEITYSGSAFGVLQNGEGVFINSRIVTKMDLEPGINVYAQVLPNFTDKRDQIPWRVVNIDPPRAGGPTDEQIVINELVEDQEEVKDIYDLLDLHLSEIRSSLHRQRDLIRKVEVYESAD